MNPASLRRKSSAGRPQWTESKNTSTLEFMTSKKFFTYMLCCRDGSLYTGWTTDLAKRLHAHNTGKGARYTRSRLPVELLASWTFDTQTEAMRFEHQVKRLSRTQKLALVTETQA
jgi:putative endonuclease